MADISKNAIDSLATKIEGLDLTSEELTVLDGVLSAAEAVSGVEGFRFTAPEPLSFGLPDLRGRMKLVLEADPFGGKGDGSRSVVINHEEQ